MSLHAGVLGSYLMFTRSLGLILFSEASLRQPLDLAFVLQVVSGPPPPTCAGGSLATGMVSVFAAACIWYAHRDACVSATSASNPVRYQP